MERIRKIERKIEQGIPVASVPSAGSGQPGGSGSLYDDPAYTAGYDPAYEAGYDPAYGISSDGTVRPAESPEIMRTVRPKAAPEDLKQVRAMWKSIVAETQGMFRVVLSAAEPKFNAQDENDNRLFVVFADFLAERYLNNTERKRELEQIIADKTGKQVEVSFVLAADESIQRGTLSKIDLEERIHEFIHTDIEIEDES